VAHVVKKDVKSKVVAKNGCEGRLMVKILITIQVNLWPDSSKTWRMQNKFTQIVVIKNLPSQPFLGRHLGFHNFFQNRVHTFLQLGFLIRL